MADITVDQEAIVPFESDRESQHKTKEGPALIFNPQASLLSVIAAASSRAQTLHCLLDAVQSRDQAGEAQELAFIAEPIAQEIELILAHLWDMAKLEVAHG